MQTTNVSVVSSNPSWFSITETGLTVERSLTKAEWTQIGTALGNLLTNRLQEYDTKSSGTKWAIGDWLVYGELNDGYMRQIARAAEITGLAEGTLNNCRRVSKAFVPQFRVAGATWAMHADVTGGPLHESLELLERAVKDKWEPLRWKAAVNARKEVRGKEQGTPAPTAPVSKVKGPRGLTGVLKDPLGRECPHCHHPITNKEWKAAKKVFS